MLEKERFERYKTLIEGKTDLTVEVKEFEWFNGESDLNSLSHIQERQFIEDENSLRFSKGDLNKDVDDFKGVVK